MSNYIPNNQSSAEKDLNVAENNYSAIEKMYDNFIVTPITKKAEEETKNIIAKLGCQDDDDNILKRINTVSEYVSSIGNNTAAIKKAINEETISETFSGVIADIQDNTDSSLLKVKDEVDKVSEKLETVNENLSAVKEAVAEEKIGETFAGLIAEIQDNTDSSLLKVKDEVDKVSEKLETANENLSAVKEAIAEEICVLKEKTESITRCCENSASNNEKLKKMVIALLVANIISVAEATALIVLFFFR